MWEVAGPAAIWLQGSQIELAFLGFLPQHAVPTEGGARQGTRSWHLEARQTPGISGPVVQLVKAPGETKSRDVGGFFFREKKYSQLIYLEWYSVFYLMI